MTVKLEKASKAGFCYGVKRAISMLEKAAAECGHIEALGGVVHNQQVMDKLARSGVSVVKSVAEIKGNKVAIGAHGVGPTVEDELRRRFGDVINTTCPFVHRAQLAARRLSEAGFFVVVFGDADHPEVKGILGWAGEQSSATTDGGLLSRMEQLPRRLGILSQTTQIPDRFTEFTRKLVDVALVKDAEMHIIDTICHDIRERQQAALELARRVDLMLVVGSKTSANTKHLAGLCATATRTESIETASDIQRPWIQDCRCIGVTGGASTADETIDEVLAKLKAMV